MEFLKKHFYNTFFLKNHDSWIVDIYMAVEVHVYVFLMAGMSGSVIYIGLLLLTRSCLLFRRRISKLLRCSAVSHVARWYMMS